MSTPKILAVGAAVQDVYLMGKIFRAHRDGGDLVQEFALGTKNDIEGVVFCTGGGATNASVTFARQGLHSAYLGRIGDDIAGRAVLDDLHKEGVDTSLVYYSKQDGTGYSTLMLAPNGERTILTYRGASSNYELQKKHFDDFETDWIYISSLSGDVDALKIILEFAKENNVKVAINPGNGELRHAHTIKEFFPIITILSVNKEEMQMLFNHGDTRETIKRATEHVQYVLVTDGPHGSYASDGQKLYHAGMYEDVPVVDRAGAGDAFSSGFTAMIAKGANVVDAMTFASANSTSVVSQIGAKTGILHAHSHIHDMPVEITDL